MAWGRVVRFYPRAVPPTVGAHGPSRHLTAASTNMPASTGRSREEQRAQTRHDLLDAAARVFATKGFHAASVDDVAEAAGYTKGAVYSNFSSKEELFLALFDDSARQTLSTVDAILDAPPDERIGRLGQERETLTFFQPQWMMLEAEFTLYVARNPHLRPKLVERQLALREQVAAQVERHLSDLGLVTEHDPRDLARLIGAAGDGLTMQQVAEGEAAPDMGRLFAELLEIIVRGATSPDGTANMNGAGPDH